MCITCTCVVSGPSCVLPPQNQLKAAQAERDEAVGSMSGLRRRLEVGPGLCRLGSCPQADVYVRCPDASRRAVSCWCKDMQLPHSTCPTACTPSCPRVHSSP